MVRISDRWAEGPAVREDGQSRFTTVDIQAPLNSRFGGTWAGTVTTNKTKPPQRTANRRKAAMKSPLFKPPFFLLFPQCFEARIDQSQEAGAGGNF
jgi:hypothetical protein